MKSGWKSIEVIFVSALIVFWLIVVLAPARFYSRFDLWWDSWWSQ